MDVLKGNVLKVALVHDWLVTNRGGEKVLLALCDLYPEAPIFTLFYDPKQMPPVFQSKTIIFPKWLSGFKKIRKLLLPFLPSIIESFDLSKFDLIISSSSCVAKGIIPRPDAKHICYLHSPMRYIWDQRHLYMKSISRFRLAAIVGDLLGSRLRTWDVISSHRVDLFIVNSSFVADRVKRYYGRESKVVHPPVSLETNNLSREIMTPSKKYFVCAGAFVYYKRFDLAIRACIEANSALVVMGSGPEEKNLRKLAERHDIKIVISPDNQHWSTYLGEAQALLFPGVEDFGIVPIEAMLLGTPVIALKRGGALDYVIDHKNGLFFTEETSSSLAEVLIKFDRDRFNREEIIKSAQRFSKEIFVGKMKSQIKSLCPEEL